MLMLGFAKMDFAPEGDLLTLIAQRFEADLHLYQHQAVANIFYSLARLQQYEPTVCNAVQRHVREHVYDFTPQVGSKMQLHPMLVNSIAHGLKIWQRGLSIILPDANQ